MRERERQMATTVGDQLAVPWEREDAREWDVPIIPTRRRYIEAYGDWLKTFPLATFVTFTWSDESAGGRYIYTDRAAVKDVERFLHRELGYPGQYWGVVEDHRHRDVLHVHALMENCVDWRFVWRQWHRTRGLFCSRPAEAGAFYYAVKYALKDGRCAERVFERLIR